MKYHSSHEELKKRSEQMEMPMPEVQELPPTPPTPSGISGEGVEYLLNEFQVDPSWQSTDPADEDYIEGVKAAYRDVVELIQQARLDYPA